MIRYNYLKEIVGMLFVVMALIAYFGFGNFELAVLDLFIAIWADGQKI